MSTKRLLLQILLAAFLLTTWVTLASTGIAHADTPSTSGTSSSSEGAASEAKPSKPERPKPKPKRAAKKHETKADDTTESAGSVKPADKSTAPDEKAEAASKQDDPSSTQVRHKPRRPSLTVTSTKSATPDKPVGDAAITSAPRAQLKLAEPAPSVSSPQTSAPSVRLPQPREVVGLVSDVGVVAVSVVYTAADTVANIFGPHSFFGAPYALASAVANSAAAVGRTLIGAPSGATGTEPFPVTYGILNGLAFFTPRQPPPGANDPSIKLTAAHPLPIILLNGTTTTQGVNWSVGAPVLANAGYKVYTFNYGNVGDDPNYPIQATDNIRESAKQLAAEVNKVLEETQAPKVILIGHSQGGGILPAYYINNLGGADKVSQVIGIAPSNHGTDASGLIGLQALPIIGPLLIGLANALGPALEQQSMGNPFQQEVYGNGDTRPGVLYTNIISKNDEIVTPYTQQLLQGDNVTNVVLQDLYPGLPAGHLGVVLSPQVWFVVLDALAANAAANPLAHNDELVA
ncbi:triacylglycerol lipase [Mycobacterium sp. ACS1612]|uniref:esterase/lipase family protein n=1 Tax=Mycobacterium sp. ACS1612 TaxID=1834117 RepID=UPI000AE92A22|nr:alpha/beta fold hydrolase [Mycobacterium sp. ACS1612]